MEHSDKKTMKNTAEKPSGIDEALELPVVKKA